MPPTVIAWRQNYFKARREEAIKLLENGFTQAQAAERLNVSKSTLSRSIAGKQALGTYNSSEPLLYEPIRKALLRDARKRGHRLILVITANERHQECIPDLRGDLDGRKVVVEVKNEPIRQRHIAQVRRYQTHFDAEYGFLISSERIPCDIWRPREENIDLAHFDGKNCCGLAESPFSDENFKLTNDRLL